MGPKMQKFMLCTGIGRLPTRYSCRNSIFLSILSVCPTTCFLIERWDLTAVPHCCSVSAISISDGNEPGRVVPQDLYGSRGTSHISRIFYMPSAKCHLVYL